MGKLKRNNRAVSEVLDTILLLGIAISLFSVLSFIVLSYPFEPSTPDVSIISYVDENDIIIQHRGGENLGLDTTIGVTINTTDSYSFKIDDVLDLNSEIRSNNYFNIGETIIINSTTNTVLNQDIKKSQIDLIMIDINSNSVLFIGTLREAV